MRNRVYLGVILVTGMLSSVMSFGLDSADRRTAANPSPAAESAKLELKIWGDPKVHQRDPATRPPEPRRVPRRRPRHRGDLFTNVLDRDEVSWASVRNMTSSQFHTDFLERANAGMMLLDYEFAEVGGNHRVSGVWQHNADARPWTARRNLSSAAFHDVWNDLKNQGFVLIDQESYILNSSRYYAGIWVANLEAVSWASYRNVTSAEFSQRFQTYRDAGFIPIDLDAYATGGGARYSAIWIRNTFNYDWALRRNLTSSQFSTEFQQYKNEFRLLDTESYRFSPNGTQFYGAIWIENRNGRKWAALRNLSSKDFSDRWKRFRDRGYRLTDFEVYPITNGVRYAGVWRQNSDRPDWLHKDSIDDLLEGAMDQFDIPGMSVAVARDGKFLYVRGLGFADIDDEKIAHGGTIYRLASISKAVGGVLSLDLEERGFIDLGTPTRDYVPSLPAFHTHDVWHTLSNRSGIGHYSQNGSPGDIHFFTALSALGFFQNNPLNFAPGNGSLYSTHAYTAAGAAFESAVGKPIDAIIDDELNQRYGLGTLAVENKHVSLAERATLYSRQNGNNVERMRDDLSWKRLGGGLESSVTHLTRFGNKILTGEILGPIARNTLWTPPDAMSNYAYGWNTGTDQCTPVVAKNGRQRGANAYLRIYPDLGVVVAVLSNRDNGGHSATTMGRAVGAFLVNEACN